MTTKFKVGDKVIADGEKAVITQIISAPDSDWDKTTSYAVNWPTNEWGTFTENELKKVVK